MGKVTRLRLPPAVTIGAVVESYGLKSSWWRRLLGDGRWHSADELRQVAGWRYGARLYELRRGEDGRPPLVIDVRCESGGLYEYQCTGVGR
jgi:hypothetical protein